MVVRHVVEEGRGAVDLNKLSSPDGQKLARMKYFSDARCSMITCEL